MGEVRAKVRLINAGDEAMARRGQLPQDSVRSYEADALVDTGSVFTVLPVFVVGQLGLATVRRVVVEHASGQVTAEVTEPVEVEVLGRRTTEDPVVLGNEVIIGQLVLEATDLFVDPINQRVIGNPAHPDQPVLKVK